MVGRHAGHATHLGIGREACWVCYTPGYTTRVGREACCAEKPPLPWLRRRHAAQRARLLPVAKRALSLLAVLSRFTVGDERVVLVHTCFL